MRWSEEVLLLLEEMRRVIAYHEWHADWWEELAFTRLDLSPANEEGLAAYTFRQAAIRRTIHNDCQHFWRNVVAYANGSTDEL